MYIGDGVSTLSELEGTEIGLDLINSEGELSVQTPNEAGSEEPINGFPEGRLTKVTGKQAAAFGFNNKISARGGIGLGAYANIRTEYGVGIGYGTETSKGGKTSSSYGRGNIGIGYQNGIVSKYGSVAIGKHNKIGHIIQLTQKEREDIKAAYVDGVNVKEPVEGRTHGGYLKDTIYLKCTDITPFGHSTYAILTEQNMNPSTIYVDPTNSNDYAIEYTDKDGVKHTIVALCKLSAVNKNGSSEIEGAVALGYGNRVTDTGAIATGVDNWADGFGSFTSGEDNEAHGNRAFVTGYNNIAYSDNGFVSGSNHYIVGTGNDDLAVFGRWSKNKDNLLFAVGNGTSDTDRKNAFEIYNDGSFTINGKTLDNYTNLKAGEGLDSIIQTYSDEVDSTHYGNTCTGQSSVALGEANEISGKRSLTTGKMNICSGGNSFMLGLGNKNASNHNIVSGQYNEVIVETIDGIKYNPMGVNVCGSTNKVYSINTIVGGTLNDVKAPNSITTGKSNINKCDYSIISGTLNDVNGQASIVAGISNKSYGQSSAVFGKNNTNNSETSFIAGANNNISSGRYNTILGYTNKITEQDGLTNSTTSYALVAGYNNTLESNTNNTKADSSIVGGNSNKVTKSTGLTVGIYNENNSQSGIVAGVYNKNNAHLSIVAGQYNEGRTDTLLELGNGTSDTNRKNAFTVLKDGRAKIQSAAIENDDILRYQDKVELNQSISALDSKVETYKKDTDSDNVELKEHLKMYCDTEIYSAEERAKNYTDKVKNDILGDGISQTFDTLKEIQDWIEGDGVNTIELTTAIVEESTIRENKDLELAQSISDIESDLDSKLSISTIDQTFFDTLY